MDKINIKDLSLLRFKKCKQYKILFIYDKSEYLLISDNDDESYLSLYERVKVADNRYTLKLIAGAITVYDAGDLINDISKRKPEHTVYSNIDREYFVKMLTSIGLIESLYSDEYRKVTDKIEKLRDEIFLLNTEINTNMAKYFKTRNKGSKCYDDTVKIAKAERIKGAQDGEWCEEYQAYYGSKHPEYGGKLVDLYNLSVGTHFYCANGMYDAYISYDSHGDKCVCTCKGIVKLNKNHHSLYIK